MGNWGRLLIFLVFIPAVSKAAYPVECVARGQSYFVEPNLETISLSFAELPGADQELFLKKRSAILEQLCPIFDRLTFKRNRQIKVTKLLGSIDDVLWSHASIIARQNEFGFVGSLGIGLGGAIHHKSIWAKASLGILVGYNSESETLVLELFRDWERIHKAELMFEAVVMGKAMFYAAHRDTEAPLASSAGMMESPPGPFISIHTPDHLGIGASLSVGLPTAPLDAFVIYESKLERTPWLRLEFTKKPKRWLRLKLVNPCAALYGSS